MIVVRYIGLPPEDEVIVSDPKEVEHRGRLAIVEGTRTEPTTGESPEDPLYLLKFANGWRWAAFGNEIEVING